MQEGTPENPSKRIFTAANMVTILRLVLVPVFFLLLISGKRVPALFLFALAASTDWVDGQIARRTNTVTEIGKALDPLVDRLLLAAGVFGLYWIGELPLWIMLVVILRDVYLAGWMVALERYASQTSFNVVFIGKLTTALLLIGFVFLLIGWPYVPGLHIIDVPWLPGLGSSISCIGYWFVYVGIVFSLLTALFYTIRSYALIAPALKRESQRAAAENGAALKEAPEAQLEAEETTGLHAEPEPHPESHLEPHPEPQPDDNRDAGDRQDPQDTAQDAQDQQGIRI